MATIDGKPSRRRPGYTRQDVDAARRQQVYGPKSKAMQAVEQARSVRADPRAFGIADELLRDPTIDAPKSRQG